MVLETFSSLLFIYCGRSFPERLSDTLVLTASTVPNLVTSIIDDFTFVDENKSQELRSGELRILYNTTIPYCAKNNIASFPANQIFTSRYALGQGIHINFVK